MQPWGPYLSRGERHLVFGVSGSGKTTEVERLTCEAWRCAYFDVEGSDYTKPGRLVVTVAELERYPKLLKDPHARLVVLPRVDLEDDKGKELGEAKSLALEARTFIDLCMEAGDMVAVLAEAGRWCREWDGEQSTRNLVHRGRKRGLVPVIETQLVTGVHPDLRIEASDVWVKQQTHRKELDTLTYEFDSSGELARRAESWVPYLPAAHWVRGKGVVA